MLIIQKELRSIGMAGVVDKYALKAKRHAKHQNLVLFKYDQIDSPVGEPAVWDCRALILDESDGWAVVSFPYRRFFNHGEVHATPLDWSTARVYEKEDGSLITLYWYGGSWHASTSGTPDGSSALARVYDKTKSTTKTFSERFFELLGGRIPSDDTGFCFMFELCTSENRIVVEHPTPRVVLHGVRNTRTLLEHDAEPFAERYGWEMCRSYPLGSIEQIMKTAETLQPNEHEGYIVRDAAFNRVKVKAPQYVALHHVANGNSPRRLLEMVRMNESAEWLAYFPNLRADHDAVKQKYNTLLDRVAAAYAPIKDIAVQKDFAMAAKNHPFSAALFRMRQGKTARSFFADMPIRSLCTLVGIDDSEPEQEAA